MTKTYTHKRSAKEKNNTVVVVVVVGADLGQSLSFFSFLLTTTAEIETESGNIEEGNF